MAANLKGALNFKSNHMLFRSEESLTPTIFYASDPSDDLRNLILKNGGAITDNAEEASLLLCEKRTDPKIDEGYLPYSYIVDCAMKNKMLNVDQYRKNVLGFKTSTSTNIDSGDDDDCGIADEIGPLESAWIKVTNGDMMGRRKYTHLDDYRIIEYLIKQDCCSKIGGNSIWKQMESLKITQHSYQSMKSRFKLISQQLDNYDIPDDWKVKLKRCQANLPQNELLVGSHKDSESPASSDGAVGDWINKRTSLRIKSRKTKEINKSKANDDHNGLKSSFFSSGAISDTTDCSNTPLKRHKIPASLTSSPINLQQKNWEQSSLYSEDSDSYKSLQLSLILSDDDDDSQLAEKRSSLKQCSLKATQNHHNIVSKEQPDVPNTMLGDSPAPCGCAHKVIPDSMGESIRTVADENQSTPSLPDQSASLADIDEPQITDSVCSHQNSDENSSSEDARTGRATTNSKKLLQRMINFMSKHYKMSPLKAAYLLKAFNGNFLAAMQYLNDDRDIY